MRYAYYSKGLLLTSALTIFILIITSCSAVEIKKVTAQKANFYKYTSEKAGLKISVDPYREENRLQECFGCNLLSRGVLPVLVVIENQNAEDGYILLKEKSGLVMKNTNSENNIPTNSYNTNELNKAEKNLTTFAIVGGIPLMLVPVAALPAIIAVGLSLQHKAQNEREIKRNYEEKKLLDKTIYQGGSDAGFLYFSLNCKEDIQKVEGILLIMMNIRSKETIPFIVHINE